MSLKFSLEEQFKLCFLNLPNITEEYQTQVVTNMGLNKDAFIRLLIKTELEPYTDLLWLLGLKEIYLRDFHIYNSNHANGVIDQNAIFEIGYLEHICKYHPECINYNEDGTKSIDVTSVQYKIDENELTKTLLFLLENQNNINIQLKSTKYTNNLSIQNSYIASFITEKLMQEFCARKFDLVNLTYEEAEAELISLKDKNWIRENIERIDGLIQSDEDEDLYYFVDDKSELNLNDIECYIDSNMINEYADDHYRKYDITIDFLKAKLQALEANLTVNAGAKPKNDNLASISERLSYLIRLNQFFNQNECDNISKYAISNKTYRLIYDYIDFFKLFEDNRYITTAPDGYIKALIRNYRSSRKRNKPEDSVHLQINALKSTI